MISTKELADLWGISPSRIVRLAQAGRITGAVHIGNSWVFPENAQKPSDTRRKENKVGNQATAFRFPLYLYHNYKKEEIEKGFTDDEKTLLQGEQLYCKGEYQKCVDILGKLLLTSKDRYVRFGILYYLCFSNFMLCKCRDAQRYYNQIIFLFSGETLHKNELKFLISNLETYFTGNQSYLDGFTLELQNDYPEEMRIYLLLECAYSDVLNVLYKKRTVNSELYDLMCCCVKENLSELSEVLLHLYTAILCEFDGRSERCVFHIRECCRVARENNYESEIAFLMYYNSDIFARALYEQNPDQYERIRSLSDNLIYAFRSYLEFSEKNKRLQLLDENDAKLIQYAIKGLVNKEIADIVNLSENTISKRYSVLYEKTGTHSKKELIELYFETLKDY